MKAQLEKELLKVSQDVKKLGEEGVKLWNAYIENKKQLAKEIAKQENLKKVLEDYK